MVELKLEVKKLEGRETKQQSIPSPCPTPYEILEGLLYEILTDNLDCYLGPFMVCKANR